MGNDEAFLTNTINWDSSSTKSISSKMIEVKSDCHTINNYFNLKVRPWQVSIIIDIIKLKKNIYAIAETNAGKSLIY